MPINIHVQYDKYDWPTQASMAIVHYFVSYYLNILLYFTVMCFVHVCTGRHLLVPGRSYTAQGVECCNSIPKWQFSLRWSNRKEKSEDRTLLCSGILQKEEIFSWLENKLGFVTFVVTFLWTEIMWPRQLISYGWLWSDFFLGEKTVDCFRFPCLQYNLLLI